MATLHFGERPSRTTEIAFARLELMVGLITLWLHQYVKTFLNVEVNEVHFLTS